MNHLNLTSGTVFLGHPGNSELSLNPCEGNLLLVPLILWYKFRVPHPKSRGFIRATTLETVGSNCGLSSPLRMSATLLSVSFTSSGVTNNPQDKSYAKCWGSHYGFPSSPRSCKRFFTLSALQCLQADIFIFCSILLVALSRRGGLDYLTQHYWKLIFSKC